MSALSATVGQWMKYLTYSDRRTSMMENENKMKWNMAHLFVAHLV